MAHLQIKRIFERKIVPGPSAIKSTVMAESKLQSLFHDPVYYVKSFKIYAALSAKFKVLATWGDNVFSEAVVEHLPFKLNENEELRVLGVGSGSGTYINSFSFNFIVVLNMNLSKILCFVWWKNSKKRFAVKPQNQQLLQQLL